MQERKHRFASREVNGSSVQVAALHGIVYSTESHLSGEAKVMRVKRLTHEKFLVGVLTASTLLTVSGWAHNTINAHLGRRR